ncbi:MAG: BRCT domain-containing protein, partial [Planctomycetota bacterium]
EKVSRGGETVWKKGDDREEPRGPVWMEKAPMPDGRVCRADIDQGYAYIDLGYRDGVRVGMRFNVYSVMRMGRRQPKGEVRLIRVEKDFSQCSILSMEDVSNPIVMGDYIWNRFFAPGRKLTFVFVGTFFHGKKEDNRERYMRIVRKAGHVVKDKVTPDTHYAVLGENYLEDPRYRLVTDWRIDKITPEDLFEHFGFESLLKSPPILPAGRSFSVVLIGKFDVKGAPYAKERLIDFLRSDGHEVKDIVTDDTDYAVLGREYASDPRYDRVKSRKIKEIRTDDIIEWPGFDRKRGR